MKRSEQQFLSITLKSFVFGAVTCLCFYTIIRLIFWDFQFSFKEEMSNLFTIISRGGLMFAAAAASFLLIEKLIIKFSFLKISLTEINNDVKLPALETFSQ